MCFTLSQKCSFTSMIAMTGALFVVEIVVGYLTNSMALVADSFHMLSDLVSLVVGFMASRLTKRTKNVHNPSKFSFGWARAEVLGALVNAVFLVALCFSILVEAFKRMMLPEHIEEPKLVLIAGGIGLLVNIIGLLLFHEHGHSHGGHGHSHGGHGHGGGHGHNEKSEKKAQKATFDYNDNNPELTSLAKNGEASGIDINTSIHKSEFHGSELGVSISDESPDGASLNVRGVYLHVLGDALGSVIVMVSALIILYTKGDWTKYVDPTLSIIISIIILKTSIPLLKESYMILMQTVPTHIKMTDIQERLCETVPGILGVHEFHIWKLVGERIVASAHVRCKSDVDGMAVASQVKEFFHQEGIHSTTIQIESVEVSSKFPGSFDCLLSCKDDICSTRTCCPVAPSSVHHFPPIAPSFIHSVAPSVLTFSLASSPSFARPPSPHRPRAPSSSKSSGSRLSSFRSFLARSVPRSLARTSSRSPSPPHMESQAPSIPRSLSPTTPSSKIHLPLKEVSSKLENVSC